MTLYGRTKYYFRLCTDKFRIHHRTDPIGKSSFFDGLDGWKMRANKRHLPMNYKRTDNRSSWLTGYRLCVYAPGSMITNAFNLLFTF